MTTRAAHLNSSVVSRRGPSALRALVLVLFFVTSFVFDSSGYPATRSIAASEPTVAATTIAPFSGLAPPDLTAKAVYVFDATVGTELYALHAHDHRAPASLTKVATALVVLDHGNLDDTVVIDASDLADPSESQVGLEVGDTLSVRDLLFGLLIPSGNDAARALARHVGATLPGGDPAANGDPVAAFVAQMNDLVASLKLADTHFSNAIGLDSNDHYSSAHDLGVLAARGLQNPLFAEIVASPSAVLASKKRPEGYTVNTTNELLLEGLADGVKTGTTTAAGGCLIAATTFGQNQVISVVLGSAVEQNEQGFDESPARFADARALLDAIPADYQWIDPSLPNEINGLAEELSVWQTTLEPGPDLVVPAERIDELRYRLQLGPPKAPNEQVGKVLFFVGSDLLSEIPVVETASVAETSLARADFRVMTA